MKTAEEIIEENFNRAVEKYPIKNWVKDFKSQKEELEFVICAMKEYARQVAERVRQDCWDNIAGQRFTPDEMKQSILDTEIKLP